MVTTMKKTLLSIACSLALAGCGTMGNNLRDWVDAGVQDPSVVQVEFKNKIDVPRPTAGAVIVAVILSRHDWTA